MPQESLRHPNPPLPSNKTVKILCKSCSTQIATTDRGVLIINPVNSVSAIEVDSVGASIKCRPCKNWNTFIDGEQFLNMKKKSDEVLNYKPKR